MKDTQWPRYQVFAQEREGAPHQDYGSVHAPDPEMALFNARDVFVRRPECVSLWVVPANSVYSKTAQEIGLHGLGPEQTITEDLHPAKEEYHVFCKSRPAGTQTHTGTVMASSAPEAMRLAVEKYSGEKAPFAWWVFPARLAAHSNPEDIESLFAPARDKPFRLSTDFHTHSTMRSIMEGHALSGRQEKPQEKS